MLFTSLGRSVLGKTVPSVLALGSTQDLGENFFRRFTVNPVKTFYMSCLVRKPLCNR